MNDNDRCPKVSILSAVHNEQLYIRDMIESVQAQDMAEWELLLVDDGSDDDTTSIIQEYARTDQRVKLVAQGSKIGKVRAFNRAYVASRGEVIVLLGGDDTIPSNSLRLRSHAIGELPTLHAPVVAFFKIRTISNNPRFDAMTLPRGNRANRSGGSIAMNRELGDVLFPIKEDLVSEDLWLAHGATQIAQTVVERQEIVLFYRIHESNSNPRNRPFREMSDAMHDRHLAWTYLLECPRFPRDSAARARLANMIEMERLRHLRKPMSVMRVSAPLVERLAMASMSSPTLYRIRTRFYRLFSGWRSK